MTQQCNITIEREQINIQYSGCQYVSKIVDDVVEAWRKTVGQDASDEDAEDMRRQFGRG